ncbi:hypothetical protein C2G38_2170898 [Gigaspora rosea]|uniref:MULE transposase domain-containing protein n=1 Tax=Gigaspora rosea TaxID=44941 RepID=A0A397VM53_9GLOM|nr:hypothetical protein C2G38_2170898 [Gigaspora rosea]
MNKLIFFDKNEFNSLDTWKIKLINEDGSYLYEHNDKMDGIGFVFAFQTKEQKELAKFARVLCLDVNDAGEEIKAVEESFPNSSIFLCHFYVLCSWSRKLNHKRGWDDAEVQRQVVETINNMIDTNNLIEAFHYKLKYTFIRGRSGCRLDSEVYLLVEIVLRDMDFSVLLNELRIGQMNQQQRNSVFEKLLEPTDNNENNLDVMSYVCTCLDFKKCQLAYKHIFSVLAQFRIDYNYDKENENVNIEACDKNVEITKLQEDLASIIVE